ncbi:MAG: c-type cytochrome [Bacteroidota bacterium]
MKNRIILLWIALATTNMLLANPPIEEGKSIFLSRCAACHNVNKAMTGPALSGIDQRRPLDWIISFVHSSQTMVKKGDTAALAVFQKFNKVPMPDHSDLTDGQIKSIVDYIKTESKPVTENSAPFAKPGKKTDFYLPVRLTDYTFWGSFLAVVLALAVSLYYAVQLKSFERTKRGDNLSA